MSDIILGQLITTPQKRDAIHIAVAPVIAIEALEPGQHIQLNHEGKACSGKEPIGIVDPLLKHAVAPGDEFWLWVYPKTVSNLRHDWDHPALDRKDSFDLATAREWIEQFAADASGGNTSGEGLIAAATKYLEDGTVIDFGFSTADRCYEDKEISKFWELYQVVTGRKLPFKKTDTFWGCCV